MTLFMHMKPIKYIVIIFSLLEIFNCSSTASPIVLKDDEVRTELDNTVGKLAEALKEKYTKHNSQKNLRLATLPFVNESGQVSHLGISLANSIQTEIFDPSIFVLLERERIDSILREHKFNSSGLVAELSIAELGKLLGADCVLIGTINQENNYFKLNVRIVNLESAEILSIAQTRIKKSESLIEKYDTFLEHKQASVAGAYRLTIPRVIISKSKKPGMEWDGDGSPPDIKLILDVGKNPRIISKIKYNVYDTQFITEPARVIIEKSDTIIVKIFDEDFLFHDKITEFTISAEDIVRIINGKSYDFTNDHIEDFQIKLEPIN